MFAWIRLKKHTHKNRAKNNRTNLLWPHECTHRHTYMLCLRTNAALCLCYEFHLIFRCFHPLIVTHTHSLGRLEEQTFQYQQESIQNDSVQENNTERMKISNKIIFAISRLGCFQLKCRFFQSLQLDLSVFLSGFLYLL